MRTICPVLGKGFPETDVEQTERPVAAHLNPVLLTQVVALAVKPAEPRVISAFLAIIEVNSTEWRFSRWPPRDRLCELAPEQHARQSAHQPRHRMRCLNRAAQPADRKRDPSQAAPKPDEARCVLPNGEPDQGHD